jgi:hypothetical protein
MNQIEKYIRASNRLIDEVNGLSDEQFLFKPSEDEWYIGQVLHHLQKVEMGVVNQIIHYNSKSDKMKMKFKNHYRTMLLILALYLPKKYKAPIAAILPEDDVDKNVILQWESQQKQWLSRDDLKSEFKNQIVFKHPIAGYTNFSGAFAFLLAHLNHHLIQVNAIKMNKNYPK